MVFAWREMNSSILIDAVLDDAGSKGTKPRLILPCPPADCVPIYSRRGFCGQRHAAD